MTKTRRQVEQERAAKKPDTYTDPHGNTYTFDEMLAGKPSLEQTIEKELGIEAGADRSMILPYNAELGWHVPEVLYGGIKAVFAPDQARRHANVTPQEAVESATAMTGAGLGISGVMKNPTGTMPGKDLGMQIGPHARKHWDENSENIKTSPTMRMFQEISDAKATLKPKEGNFISRAIDSFLDKDVKEPTTMGAVLDHPKLYEAYPELADIKVNFFRGKSNEYGYFDPSTGEIGINKNASRREQYKTILHELQHAVQNIEGWSGGSSPDRYKKGILLEKGLHVDYDPMQLIDKNVPFYKVLELMKQQGLKREVRQKAYERYLRNEGEASARATENRRKLTQEQLNNTPIEYDVPTDEIRNHKAGGAVTMPDAYSKGKWKII